MYLQGKHSHKYTNDFNVLVKPSPVPYFSFLLNPLLVNTFNFTAQINGFNILQRSRLEYLLENSNTALFNWNKRDIKNKHI